VAFATGNAGKVREAQIILGPFGVEPIPIDAKGVEIQADAVSEVAAFSARTAAVRVGRPLIVEDAGLFVDSLHGFPGSFASHAFKTLGISGLLKLLEGERQRTAEFRSAVAYCEPSKEPMVFDGRVKGTILPAPRGAGGFGFDPIFLPDGESASMAEMTLEAKCRISHRGQAMRRFATWFVTLGP
jgi:XTP/dITP diphosphohydrolase